MAGNAGVGMKGPGLHLHGLKIRQRTGQGGPFGVESGCSEAVCLVRSYIVRERHDAFKGSGQDQKRGMCNGMFCLCYTGALELVL